MCCLVWSRLYYKVNPTPPPQKKRSLDLEGSIVSLSDACTSVHPVTPSDEAVRWHMEPDFQLLHNDQVPDNFKYSRNTHLWFLIQRVWKNKWCSRTAFPCVCVWGGIKLFFFFIIQSKPAATLIPIKSIMQYTFFDGTEADLPCRVEQK